MSFNILHHIYSALFVFSIIVLFEVIFFLKKNRSLKIILLVYISTVLLYSAVNIYCIYNTYNRLLLGIPIPLMSICFMTLFSTLCHNKVKNYIIIFSSIIIISYSSIMIYFLFINPIDLSISLSNKNILGNNLSYMKLPFLLGLLFITLNLYLHMKKKYKADNIYFKAVKNWALIFLFSIFLIFVSGILNIVLGHENLVSKYILTITLFFTVIALLFRPKFLNKSALSISLSNSFNKKIEQLNVVVFNEAFYDQLYFLNQKASLDDFSKKIGVSSETLYRFIYNNYGSGFHDLVNENRVNYFLDVVKSKKHNNYTIDALSQMAGFSSRHHLYKPFKKFHGGIPSDFMRSLDYS